MMWQTELHIHISYESGQEKCFTATGDVDGYRRGHTNKFSKHELITIPIWTIKTFLFYGVFSNAHTHTHSHAHNQRQHI